LRYNWVAFLEKLTGFKRFLTRIRQAYHFFRFQKKKKATTETKAIPIIIQKEEG